LKKFGLAWLRQGRGFQDRPLDRFVIGAHPAGTHEAHVQNFAGRQLIDLEHRFRIAGHFDRQDDVAAHLVADAVHVVGFGTGPRACSSLLRGLLGRCPFGGDTFAGQALGFGAFASGLLGSRLLAPQFFQGGLFGSGLASESFAFATQSFFLRALLSSLLFCRLLFAQGLFGRRLFSGLLLFGLLLFASDFRLINFRSRR
jgi:hypothetical protein